MAILEVRIDAVEPFAEGRAFGEAGRYLRIRGTAKGELDPAAPRNKAIADLDKAPRNARGLVEYETDFFILRPADPSRTNGVLVYDVTNRGRKRLLAMLDDAAEDSPAAANDPMTAKDAGLGFSLGRGYSLVWSGWDPGAPAANNGLTARFPTAMENGKPVTGHIRHEFHIGTRTPGNGDLVRLPYPAVSTDRRQARLAVRDRESDTRTEIRRERGNSPMPSRSDCCRGAASSRRSRSTSCGTKPPGPRCSASALPRCATSSRSCAMSAPTATVRRTR
jgi:hypothetical protein